MKISFLLFNTLLCTMLFSCKDKKEVVPLEEVKFTLELERFPSLKKIVDELESVNVVESKYVGDGGSISEQWKRYEQLQEIANIDQLTDLINYPNATVNCYAFKALVAKKSDRVFPILVAHLHDTIKVARVDGCIGMMEYVGDFFMGELLYGYEDQGYKLNEVEKEKLDSIFLYDSSIVLDTKSYVFDNLPQKELYYEKIRELVEDRNSEALVALAKYKKQEDRALIASFLKEGEDQYAALKAILEFPDEYFYEDLVNLFDYEWKMNQGNYGKWRLYYQALANYPKEKTVELFNRTFTLEDVYKREAFYEYLFLAISKYPNTIYNPIKAKMKLSDSIIRAVQFELEGY